VECHVPEDSSWDRALKARRKFVKSLVESCDRESLQGGPALERVLLGSLDAEIRDYARAYARAAGDSLSVPNGAQEANELERSRSVMRMDTVLLRQRSSGTQAEPVALLVAPSHPFELSGCWPTNAC